MSLGKNGLEVEIHEKDNVMTSGIHITTIFAFTSILLIVFSPIFGIKILGAFSFILSFTVIYSVYIIHNLKSPELLQSEKYRLEKMQTEAMMIENKHPINSDSLDLETNFTPTLSDNEEDKE